MTDRISEIRARLEAATPGPWERQDYDLTLDDEGCCILGDSSNAMRQHAIGFAHTLHSEERSTADAEFIAHSPDDIRFLLDALTQQKNPVISRNQLAADLAGLVNTYMDEGADDSQGMADELLPLLNSIAADEDMRGIGPHGQVVMSLDIRHFKYAFAVVKKLSNKKKRAISHKERS